MKKVTKTTNINISYEIVKKISYIALVKNEGKYSFINTKTNELLCPFDNYNYDIKKDYLIIFNDGKISFYDLKKDKMILENMIFKYINGYRTIAYIVENPNDLKTYIVEINENEINISESFDNIELVMNHQYPDTIIYEALKNGKKYLLVQNTKVILSKESYDKINVFTNDVIIMKKGDKKAFYMINQDSVIDETLYDEIILDNYLFISKKGSTYSVFTYDGKTLLSKYECEDIEYIYNKINKDECIKKYYFKIKQNEQYGIVEEIICDSLFTTSKEQKVLIKPKYDDIKLNENEFLLFKNNKVGIYFIGYDYLIEPKYDKISKIKNYYAYYIGNKFELKLNGINEPIIKECEFIEENKGTIIYKKDNLYGLLNLNRNAIINEYGYNSIKRNGNYYIVEKEGKYGLLHSDECVMTIYKPVYKMIEVNTKAKRNPYFKTIDFENNMSLSTPYQNHYIKDIRFYNNFIYIERDNDKFLIDYETSLIIIQTSKDNLNIEIIDGKEIIVSNGYYEYKNNKLTPLIQDVTYHITGYETKFGTITINEYTKQKHDEICKYIESLTEEELDEILINNLQKNEKLKKEYPNLVKKL